MMKNWPVIMMLTVTSLIAASCGEDKEDEPHYVGGRCQDCLELRIDGKSIGGQNANIEMPAGQTELIVECLSGGAPIFYVQAYREVLTSWYVHPTITVELLDPCEKNEFGEYLYPEPDDYITAHGRRRGLYIQRLRFTAPDSTAAQYAVITVEALDNYHSYTFTLTKQKLCGSKH